METVRFHITQAGLFSFEQYISHLVGHCEQFGAHDKFVLGAGCKVDLISRRHNINIVFFHLDNDLLSRNSFERYLKVLFSSCYI